METPESTPSEDQLQLHSLEPDAAGIPNRFRRALLETMKFLSAPELMVLDHVSKEWRHCSVSNEVWHRHLVDPAEASLDVRTKDVCKRQLRRSNFFALIEEARLTLFTISPPSVTTSVLPAPFRTTNYAAWISTPKYVLYCGGTRGREGFVADSYLIDVKTLLVQKLPNMITGRAGGGLVYNCGKVYVFGGDADRSRNPRSNFGDLKECEKYSFKRNSWTALPDMQCARRSFTPALWKDQVFIAGGGGGNESVEIFSLSLETFTLAHFQLPFTNALSSLFVIDSQLLALSESKLYSTILPESAGKMQMAKSIEDKYWYSPGGYTQKNNVIYFGVYYDEHIYRIDSTLKISVVH